ncbi:hypothetical protein [Carnobacterium mobile]|uniref:hypothetical protein n=1 Tax=Carnobacterium mobile TaxID=2750 RepID=UPI00186641EB|nr:hypothetical protein [Carnobacterium mobile]
MEQATIEKVWQIKGLLFKNEDYHLALDLEDSTHRVLMRYIIVHPDSAPYQKGMEMGYDQEDFVVYTHKEDAKQSLYSVA